MLPLKDNVAFEFSLGVYTLEGIVPAGLGPGLYAGTLTVGGVTHTFTDPDDLTAVGPGGGKGACGGPGPDPDPDPDPDPGAHEITGVLDAAGGEASISPGSIVSVFGNFAEQLELADATPLPFDLGGFSVTFDGKPGALFGIFPGDAFDQANVQVPWDVNVGDGTVEVKVHWTDETGEVWSDPFEVDGSLGSPGIYLFPAGTAQAIVTNFKLAGDDVIEGSWAQAPGTLVDPIVGQPAAIGGAIVIWGNGLGPVSPEPVVGALPAGDFPVPTKTVRVTIGGQQAQVLGAFLHTRSVGLSQINAIVPEGVEPGDAVPIIIELDCGDGTIIRSRADVTIAVRSTP